MCVTLVSSSVIMLRRVVPLALMAVCCVAAVLSVSAEGHAHVHHTHRHGSAPAHQEQQHHPAGAPSLSQRHPLASDASSDALYEPLVRPAAPRSDALRGTRPNLIFVMADDSGYGDLGANGYGADTPFLDKLAQESLRFTDFHSGSAVCTPSRANVMTGRLGIRTGVTQLFIAKSLYGLPLNETTIAEHLLAANYSTAIVGKWHLGHVDGYHPSYRGFEQTFALPWSMDTGCSDGPDWNIPPDVYCPKDPVLDVAPMAERMFSPNFARRYRMRAAGRALGAPDVRPGSPANPLYDIPSLRCGTSAEGAVDGGEHLERAPEEGLLGDDPSPPMPPPIVTAACNPFIIEQPVNLTSLSDKYAAKTDKIIRGWAAEQQAAKKRGDEAKPFFLYMPLSHMHVPMAHDGRWTGTSKSKTIYGDVLREMDWQVQSLYDVLEETGVLNNTLFIYSSDNGPWEEKCQYGGNVGPFNGTWQKSATGGGGGATAKFTTWEAGHRMPALAHWPGHVAPGVTAALSTSLDILPTFLALAGVPLPTDRSFDGLDLSPVLFDGAQTHHETLFHTEMDNGHLTAMRYHQYKAFWKTYSTGGCNGEGTGPTPIIHDTPLIFDVSVDYAEANPLQNPDPRLLAQFASLHDAMMHDVFTTPHQAANWTMGNDETWPCCNPLHVVCRCTD